MRTRWSALVELRRKSLEEAEHVLGRANAELSLARTALVDARVAEALVARQRDAAVARGLVEREWAELEAWLAKKRADTHGAAALVLEREAAVVRARETVQARTLDVFRLEALDTRERELTRKADARRERAAEDEHASGRHARASSR